MNDRELIEYLNSVQIGRLGKLYVPIAKPVDDSEIKLFEGFGIVNPQDSFNVGWKFVVHDGTHSQNLQAFCAGIIVYDNTPTYRIILRNADVLGNLTRKDSLPDWFPLPNYVIYQNIDEAETRVVIRNYLNNHQKIVAAIEEQQQASVPIDKIVDLFFSNSLPYGIPVQAGDLIGVMGEETVGSGLRSLSLLMEHELGQLLFLDPAIYHKHWESFFKDLGGHPLEMQLKKIFAGPIANGTIRYVKSGGVTTGDFKNPASPASLVSIALAAADPYDTIVILDNAVYNEPNEVTIDKAINITSLSTGDVITGPISLPTLDGNFEHRIIRIHNVNDIVSISNLGIARGVVSLNTGGQKPYGGAGIMADHAHKTYIRNCHVHDNTGGIGDSLTANGFGGGILAYHSSVMIYHNWITDNFTGDRGGGIGIFGYGWPVVLDNHIQRNKVAQGRPDGGGIGIEIAFPSHWDPWDVLFPKRAWIAEELDKAKTTCVKIIKNEIDSNIAADDGGGVYMSVLARTEFLDNKIHHNNAGHAGGGIRATMGSDLTLKGDNIHHNAANISGAENGGGGISVRNCSVDLVDVRIEDNIIKGWSGGGIFYNSGIEGPTTVPFVTFDDILRRVFDKKDNVLKIKGTTSIFRNHCEMISSLGDHRKGGGFYGLRIYKKEAPALPPSIINGLPMILSFDDINRIVSNVLDPSSTPIGSPNSVQIHIEDTIMREGTPIDDSNNSIFLTPKFGRMEFRYASQGDKK